VIRGLCSAIVICCNGFGAACLILGFLFSSLFFRRLKTKKSRAEKNIFGNLIVDLLMKIKANLFFFW
jgi:hypothetical protein